MSIRLSASATVLVVLTLVTGCVATGPTSTSAPPTPAQSPTSPTNTPVPPSATPLPPTDTPAPTATPEPAPAPFPTVTSEGAIAFYSERDGNAEIYTIRVDGSDIRRLTSNSAEDMCPAFSHDGSKIAFNSDRSGNHEIYVMSSDGSNPIRLTDTPEREYQPEWSPDGNHIAFTRYACAGWDCGEIFVMNADGSDARQVTDDPADDMHPVWSPDGTKLLFNSRRDGEYEMYIMNADGSGQQRLTDTPKADMFPRLSPDGTKIAYALVDFQTFQAQVHVTDVDGNYDIALTSDGRTNENPVWSPDGNTIVFQSDRDGNFELYVMNSDGSDQRRLTNHQAGDYWPAWKPEVAARPASSTIQVPQGHAATIDGTFSPGEWDSALTTDLTNGGELMLMHEDGFLYLGIRSRAMGFGSICAAGDNRISILHSSAGLGTAVFERDGDDWRRTQQFSYCCWGANERVLDEFLQRSGWVASIGPMGVPEEMEYQIAMNDRPLNLAVVYVDDFTFQSPLYWPANLGDDCLGLALIPEDPPERLLFSPETWVSFVAATE